MPERRRKYTPEFKDEAARMVIETSCPIAEIAREIHERGHAGELGSELLEKPRQRGAPTVNLRPGAPSGTRKRKPRTENEKGILGTGVPRTREAA
jgi:transposase-like protein